MPLAVVVAPSDPRAGDAASRRTELAWLRGQLARHGFDVVIVSGGLDPRAAIEKVAPTINSGDAVLVHVSGRLDGVDALAFGSDRSVALGVLPESFAARGPSSLSFVAELTFDDDAGPPSSLADRLEAVTAALSAGRAHPVVVALRAFRAGAPRFEATREGLGAPELADGPRPIDTILDVLHRHAGVGTPATVVRRAGPGRVGHGPAGGAGVTAVAGVVAPPLDADSVAFEPPLASAPAVEVGREVPREVGHAPLLPPQPEGAPDEPDAAIAAATAVGDWRRVAALRLDRLDGMADPKARVRELVAVARVLQAELADPEGAIAALEQARALEPTRPGVLRALRRGYEAHGRWASALDVLESLAALADGPAERASYRAAQANIALEQLHDPSAARAFLHEALIADPQHAEAMELASRLDGQPDEGSAVAGGSADPDRAGGPDGPPALEAAPYASAFAAYDAHGNIEGAFLSAMALEEIGAIGDEHRAVVERWRTVGPVRARASLDAWGWDQLRAPGYDDGIGALFATIEASAIGAKLDELREARRLPALDRAQRLPETSTASIVRSFLWGSRFLGVRCPDLYAIDDAPGMAVVHAPEPSTALGRSVLSGPSAKDLAFLAGRHLTYYRPEYHVLLYYPTRDELTVLLFAAVQLAGPEVASSPPAVRALRARLEKRLSGAERAAVRDIVRHLNERGGQAKVGAWMRAVELTAARAGLFLSGDLSTATRIVRGEPTVDADLTIDERRADLVAFCASQAHLALRTRFVATSAESLVPPPMGVVQRTAAQ
jgi:hypothetical protein